MEERLLGEEKKGEIRREERFSRSRGGREATETRQSGVKSDES